MTGAGCGCGESESPDGLPASVAQEVGLDCSAAVEADAVVAVPPRGVDGALTRTPMPLSARTGLTLGHRTVERNIEERRGKEREGKRRAEEVEVEGVDGRHQRGGGGGRRQ